MRLKVNNDLSTTYLPSKGEIEALVKDKTINRPLYYYNLEKKHNRLEIVYREEIACLQGMPLYHLKYFVVQEGCFDLAGFKSLFKTCFPKANVASLTHEEAQELCQTFVQQMMLKVS
jgi:hypothetical protein